jgi:hypothetical protein
VILLDHFIDILNGAPAPARRRMLQAYGRALRARARPPAAIRSPAPRQDEWSGAENFWAAVRARLRAAGVVPS